MRHLGNLPLLGLLVSALVSASVSAQTTYYVNASCGDDTWTGLSPICAPPDGPKRTIQAGIDAATDGDTVLVADGIYRGSGNKNLNYAGRRITLRSINGPERCIIDCEGYGIGVGFISGEDDSCVFDGFTVTNGLGYYTGGVYCRQSGPRIMNCRIVNNQVTGFQFASGGGMYLESSRATVVNCLISGNSADEGVGAWGGGATCSGGSPFFDNCTIRDNYIPSGAGGGIYSSGSNITLTNCTISGNRVRGRGGGIHCYGGNPTIYQCLITDNSASSGGGGGILCQNTDAIILGCRISGNKASTGGGIECGYGGRSSVANCIITDNKAMRGAALGLYYYTKTIVTNCTVLGNVSAYGGSVECGQHAGPTIANCVLWANSPEQISVEDADPTIIYSDVQGGWPGEGNIDADPEFAFEGDLHLLACSPCVDAGTNDPPGGLVPADLDGNPRPLDGDGNGSAIADMGAYEFNPASPSIALTPEVVEFFAPEAGPNPPPAVLSLRNCGGGVLTWEVLESCPWLEPGPPAGQSAGEIDEVKLSVDTAGLTHGQYACDLTVSDAAAVNSPRTVTVSLHVNITVAVPQQYATIQAGIDAASLDGDEVVVADGSYGGPGNTEVDFRGRNIVVRSENGPDNCLIDCQGADGAFFLRSGEGPGAVVDGFTITSGTVLDYAINCRWSGPTIRNCRLTGLDARFGPVYCDNSSAPAITACTISDNYSQYGAGAINAYDSFVTVTDCTVAYNSSAGRGGGIYSRTGNLTVIRTLIAGNETEGPWRTAGGGGIYSYDGACTLINSLIVGNSTPGSGGGVNQYLGVLRVFNCTFSRNVASDVGGAAYCFWGRGTVTNSILWNNRAAAGGELAAGRNTILEVSYSDVLGGEAGVYLDTSAVLNWALGNLDIDPGLAFADDYHLAWDSPCIDAGTNEPLGGLPLSDLDGNPRPLDGDGNGSAVADMGAYEFNPAIASIALSPATREWFVLQGSSEPGHQTLLIRNCGGQALHWQVSEACPWLEAEPPAGVSTGEIDEVRLTVVGEPPPHGSYPCTLTVSAPGAVNSPRTAETILYVNILARVPDAYTTIQAAIDAASVHGDVVLLADGTYAGAGNKDLVFRGAGITVRGQGGRERCIIDCEGSGRGFYVLSQDHPIIIEELTLRRGSAQQGGAIYSAGSDLSVRACTLTGNTASQAGGGLRCARSKVNIVDCFIAGNLGGSGAGLYFADRSRATIIRCTVGGNSGGWGAGIAISQSRADLRNVTVTGNTASGTYGMGGGLGVSSNGRALVNNCTISANTANRGGGIRCSDFADVTVSNSLLWADSAQLGPEISLWQYGTASVSYTDVQGGPGAVSVEGGTLNWGPGNLDVDPGFVDPGNDFHLAPGSPCFNAGDPAFVPLPGEKDIDGDPRVLCGRVDMGSDEYRRSDDLDCDSDVDLADFTTFQLCFGGSGNPPAPSCQTGVDADLDGDGDVDLADFSIFQAHYTSSF